MKDLNKDLAAETEADSESEPEETQPDETQPDETQSVEDSGELSDYEGEKVMSYH